MTISLSGPMFAGVTDGLWESVHKKEGGHYNNYGCHDRDGMEALRTMFPEGDADELNAVLFSTSGVHGLYNTIEEAEQYVLKYQDGSEPGDDCDLVPDVTFLVVHPRLCTVRHGNCIPQNSDDIDFLKRLRESSWAAFSAIGRHSE